jgi:hypothetical protein
MPNTLNNATLTKVATAAIAALYQNVNTLPTLRRDIGDALSRGEGDTARVRIDPTVAATNFAGTANAADLTEKFVDVKVDQQPNSQITLTAKELTFGVKDLATQVIAPQMRGLAEYVDTFLNTKLVLAAPSAAVGGALTSATKVLVAGRKALNDTKTPFGERYCVLTSADAATLLGITGLLDASQTNDQGLAWREGFLGRKFGTDFYESQFATTSVMYHSTAVPVAFAAPAQPLGGAVSGTAAWDGIVAQTIAGWDNGSLSNKMTAHLLFGAKENLDGGGAGTGKRAVKLSFAAVTGI